MNARTLKALEGSICKWDDICMGYGLDRGVKNCPLCELFYTQNCECRGANKRLIQCYDCPASRGVGECNDTPYVNWVMAWNAVGHLYLPFPELSYTIRNYQCREISDIIDGAEAELVFLLGLLPKDHKWYEQI